ncbi:MAG: PAS domain S-box protein [bacterium]
MPSDDRYRQLFDNMGEGVAIYEAVDRGEDFVFVDYNEAGQRIDGVTRDEVVGRRVTEVFPGVRALGLLDVLERVWRTGSPERHPTGLYQDDRIFGYRVNQVYKLPDGKLVAVYSDETERKLAQERAGHLNRVLRAIRAVSRLIVTERRRDALIRRVCEILVEARGYRRAWIVLLDDRRVATSSAEAGLGESFSSLRQELEAGELPPCCQRALDLGEIVVAEAPSSDCGGCPIAGTHAGSSSGVTVRLEHGGRIFGAIGLAVPNEHARDPEELSLAHELADDLGLALHGIQQEEARRHSEEKYRLLAENVTDVVWTMDMGLRFVFVSPSIFQLRGYTAEETMAQSLSDLMAPESLSEAMALLAVKMQLVEAGDAAAWDPIVFEAEQPCKDGTTVITRNNAKIIPGADGLPSLIVGVTHDITERKRAEESLRKSEEHLRQAQKMEAVGRLAGGVAHDFNNLLTVINGCASLALDDLREADPLRSDLQQILEAGDRATALTRQLLAFSRRQVMEPRVLDLGEIVGSLEKMLRRIIGEDIELRTDLAEGLGRVVADPGQMEQVVMNLAINSRDAMPTGGKLTIETANVELDEEDTSAHPDTAPGAYVMLALSDNGGGMDAETRERIFEPFFTTKELGQGTGLGLAMVYGIVKQSSGDIWVDSEPGRGTTFRVFLPRVEAERDGRAKELNTIDLRGTETILVVEDEEAVRNMTLRILAAAGYKVIGAASGSEALLHFDRHDGDIHLVLTDVVMPRMSGRELASRLAVACPGLRVLYMSGYTDDAIVHHGVLDEGTHFIGKPFTIQGLLEKVRAVLDSG